MGSKGSSLHWAPTQAPSPTPLQGRYSRLYMDIHGVHNPPPLADGSFSLDELEQAQSTIEGIEGGKDDGSTQ